MTLHIDRFEEELHALIAERGKEYFDAHQVSGLRQTTDGWTMMIEGGETYEVLLEGHDEITHWQCTCPFDHGPVCKHVAAALYAVREAIDINRANAGGELDRWIEEASDDELRRLMKIMVRVHEGARAEVWKAVRR